MGAVKTIRYKMCRKSLNCREGSLNCGVEAKSVPVTKKKKTKVVKKPIQKKELPEKNKDESQLPAEKNLEDKDDYPEGVTDEPFCDEQSDVSSFKGGADVYDTSTNEKFVASLKRNSRRIDKSLGRSAVQRDLRRKLPAIKKIVEEGENKWEQMMKEQISNCSKAKRQPSPPLTRSRANKRKKTSN